MHVYFLIGLLMLSCCTDVISEKTSDSKIGIRRIANKYRKSSWKPSAIRKLGALLGSSSGSKASWSNRCARAIIVPHAGFKTCGDTAAFAYREVNPSLVKRIFILGPSHFYHIKTCALSFQQKYESLFYDLTIDQKVYDDLEQAGQFERISLAVDENEHSLGNTLPYLAKIMENYKDAFKIVPVLVGRMSPEEEDKYGKIFSKYLADPSNLFVISTDFCHWGSRFQYQYYDQSKGHIYQSIQHVDELGMEAIKSLSPRSFRKYLKKYKNTICGRGPIGVFLSAVQHLPENEKQKMDLRFLKYSQNRQRKSMNDSSVSFAAGALFSA